MLQQHHIEAIIGEKAGKPAAQRNLLRVLRQLLNIAVKMKMRRDNPAVGIELERIETSGYHSGARKNYSNTRCAIRLARLALDLLLYTARRRADVVTLGSPNMRNGRFIYTASKNRALMDIPIAEPLVATIAATSIDDQRQDVPGHRIRHAVYAGGFR